MNAKVPTIDIGNARLGMIVAVTLRRNTKITAMTRTSASSSDSWTSRTDARMETDRSKKTLSWIAGGSWDSKVGRIFLTASTISMVFVPGWRCTASMMPRVPLCHAAILSFWTLSNTRPTSLRRTGAPLR